MRRCGLAGIGAVLLMAGTASAADPVYTVYACHLPDGTPAPADGFTGTAGGDATVENRCGDGGGLYLELPDGPISATTAAQWEYRPPTGTTIASVSVTRELHNIGGSNKPSHRYYALGTDSQLAENCGASSLAACPPLADLTLGEPASSFSMGLLCHYDYNDCLGPDAGAGFVSLRRAAITLKDSSAPTFTAHPTGDLFAPGPVRGVRSAQVSASDEGGGVFAAAMVVDGNQQDVQVLDANDGACERPFTSGTPCKRTALGSLALDTTKLRDGQHTVAVVVYDATEVNSATSPTTTISVENMTTSARPGEPITGGSASFAPGGLGALHLRSRQFTRKVIRARFDRPTLVTGRLLDPVGKPLPGATLTVASALNVPGAEERPTETAVTDASGRFRLEIPAGPSRRVILRAGTSEWSLRLVVPAPLRLLASRMRLRNKQKLMLTAYLLGARVPRRSAEVAFQVLIGHQWRTFATRPIDRRGRAQIAHRFRVTYQRLTYRFRAIVVRRQTFPFENATSPPVAVRVN